MQAGFRTLAIWRLLRQHSDEEHPMNAVEIAERLKSIGMEVERRSIYRSIEELEEFGVDIVHMEQKTQGFYLGQREFELPEMKLLMDAVQAARFITSRKSKELVNKIAGFASVAQRDELMKSVFVEDRAKCMNEQIYYNIDNIYTAIRTGRQITFQYCEFNLKKYRVARKNGELYKASPYALDWNNDAYYLISRIGEHREFTHFRVDRMKDVHVLEEASSPYSDFYNDEQLNIADYGKRALSMFAGPVEQVQIRFKNQLVTAVIDKLGTDVRIVPDKEGWFIMKTGLVVSPGLTAWLAHFSDDAEIISPEHARTQVRDTLRVMLDRYEQPV